MTTITVFKQGLRDNELNAELCGRRCRILGDPLSMCPFKNPTLMLWWVRGWKDADEDIRIANQSIERRH